MALCTFLHESSIRRDFSTDTYTAANAENRSVYNVMHASDSPETAAVELGYWFGDFLEPEYLHEHAQVDRTKEDHSLVILSPEARQRGIDYLILERLERMGIAYDGLMTLRPSEAVARAHYEAREKRPANLDEKIAYLTQGVATVMSVKGLNVVDRLSRAVGREEDPIACAPGTIRFDFSSDNLETATSERRAVYNVIHVSRTIEEGRRQVAIWFDKFFAENYGAMRIAPPSIDQAIYD